MVLGSLGAYSDGYQGLGAESIPTEKLQKYSPPALAPEMSRKIQRYFDIRSPGIGRIHPSGKKLFFPWSVTGITQVWRIDGPQGFPVQMTGGEDPTSLVTITQDGKFLVLSRDQKGEENPGLYLQPTDGGALEVIQHKKGIKTHYQFSTDDSKYLYFVSNDQAPDSYAIYRYNIAQKTRELVFNEPGLWSVADFLENGKKLLLEKSMGSMWSEFYLWEADSKKLTPVLGQGEREEYNVNFSSNSDEYLVNTNKFGNFRRLYRFKNGKWTPLTEEMNYDIESFTIDYPRRKIYYEVNKDGFTELSVRDAKSFKPISLPKLPTADHTFYGSISRDGRYVVLGIETSKAPRTTYILDWNTRKTTQWVLPSQPEFDTSTFADTKLEHYVTRDNVKIPMFVRRPEKCQGPCPVVVNFHGGPEGQTRPGFSPYAQIFVDHGFIYVEPNVRGSDGYGKAWLNSDNGPLRENVITDIEDCAKYIKTNWASAGISPKVGVMGYSYGGYSTLVAMTRFAGSYDAGASGVGMSNLRSFLLNTAPYRRILRINEYGDPEKDKDALMKLSPIRYVDRVRDPLLIIQGVSDPRVPAGEAIQIQESLQQKGIPSELILMRDEGHGSQKRDNRVIELGNILRFFEKHLKKTEIKEGKTS